MKTIQWPDNLKYPGAGWALARIDGDETIISTHRLLGPGAPSGLTLQAETEWHINAALEYAQEPGPGAVVFAMVSCYELCDPRPWTEALPTIARVVADELVEYAEPSSCYVDE